VRRGHGHCGHAVSFSTSPLPLPQRRGEGDYCRVAICGSPALDDYLSPLQGQWAYIMPSHPSRAILRWTLGLGRSLNRRRDASSPGSLPFFRLPAPGSRRPCRSKVEGRMQKTEGLPKPPSSHTWENAEGRWQNAERPGKAAQSHLKATLKPVQSHHKAIYLGVQSHLKATPRPPQSHLKATQERR
jgi:hypothetical protein